MGTSNTPSGATAVAAAVLLVVSAAGPAVGAGPEVTVRVGGSTLADGGSVTVTGTPEVTVEATAESTIESVSIRVDGEERRTFSPGSDSMSETVTLDLDDGPHDVTVVAVAGETTRHGGTVTKDTESPRVRYTAPFSGVPSRTEVLAGGNVTIAGEVTDLSDVDRVVIERTYEWEFRNEVQQDKLTHRITDPKDSFSRPLPLGPGENQMRVVAVDAHGHKGIQTWTIRVEDEREPRIGIDSVERIENGSAILVNGTVSDNTKVESLAYAVVGLFSRQYVLEEVQPEPTRERVSAEFEFTASLGESVETITMIAMDTAGNRAEREVRLDIEGRAAPTISIDDATGRDGDGVHVVGTVADGRITRVTVASVGPDGETIERRTIHAGNTTGSVAVDEYLPATSAETEVVVRATDTMDRDHAESVRIPAVEATEGDGDTTAAPTATSTATPTPTATEGSGGSAPGFGAVAAVGALLAAVLVARRSG